MNSNERDALWETARHLTSPSGTRRDEPLTIERLRAEGKRLGLVCRYCHRFRYLNDSRFAESEKVAGIAQKLTCARCGSKDVETVAVSRDPKTGYWPAERS